MSNKPKLISQKELDSVPSLKDFKKLKKRAIAIGSNKVWVNEDNEILEAEMILHKWLQNAIKKGNTDMGIKIAKIMGALNSASQVFFKAYTCEIMQSQYERRIEKYQTNELEFSERIKKLEKENNNLKQNLEL